MSVWTERIDEQIIKVAKWSKNGDVTVGTESLIKTLTTYRNYIMSLELRCEANEK